MWFGPHRNHLRFSVIWRDTRHRGDCQADCCGPTAGGIPGKRRIRVGDFRRTAWDYFWWRSLGLPRGSRISGSPGRREAAGECSPRRAIFAGTVDVTWRAFHGGAGSPGARLHSGLQLDIPARPIVEQAFGAGVLFNSTQDTVLRFLPPFLLQEKHVDKGVRVLKKLLGKAKKARDAAAAS